MKAARALAALRPALSRSIGGAPKVRCAAPEPLETRTERALCVAQLSCSQVAITVVDPQGRRFPVFGRVGTSLAEAMAGSTHPELVGSTVQLSPKHGPEGHVRVAHEFARRMGPLDDDAADELRELCEEVADDSRLASKARSFAVGFRLPQAGAARALLACASATHVPGSLCASGGVRFSLSRRVPDALCTAACTADPGAPAPRFPVARRLR